MSTRTNHDIAPLTKEEAAIFDRRLKMARGQIEEIDAQIERELADVRERIAALQEERAASLKIYDAACTMLGIENELENEPVSDRAAS